MKDKNKIEGAYLLLRRFKNRLKGLDEVIQNISKDKASHTDFDNLKKSLDGGRAQSVFDDMKVLLESTT